MSRGVAVREVGVRPPLEARPGGAAVPGREGDTRPLPRSDRDPPRVGVRPVRQGRSGFHCLPSVADRLGLTGMGSPVVRLQVGPSSRKVPSPSVCRRTSTAPRTLESNHSCSSPDQRPSPSYSRSGPTTPRLHLPVDTRDDPSSYPSDGSTSADRPPRTHATLPETGSVTVVGQGWWGRGVSIRFWVRVLGVVTVGVRLGPAGPTFAPLRQPRPQRDRGPYSHPTTGKCLGRRSTSPTSTTFRGNPPPTSLCASPHHRSGPPSPSGLVSVENFLLGRPNGCETYAPTPRQSH